MLGIVAAHGENPLSRSHEPRPGPPQNKFPTARGKRPRANSLLSACLGLQLPLLPRARRRAICNRLLAFDVQLLRWDGDGFRYPQLPPDHYPKPLRSGNVAKISPKTGSSCGLGVGETILEQMTSDHHPKMAMSFC